MPSEKNSCSGSSDRFWSGSTAIEVIGAGPLPFQGHAAPAATATRSATIPAAIGSHRRRPATMGTGGFTSEAGTSAAPTASGATLRTTGWKR
jgi:hypothetical protein